MLTFDEFRDTCIERLKSTVSIEGVVESAVVVRWQGRELRVYLDRPYSHYLLRPHQLEEIVTHFFASMLGTAPSLTSFASVCSFVFPLLKPMGFVAAAGEQIQRAQPGFATAMCYREWNGLGICYVIDEPNSSKRVFVTSDHMDRWKIDFSELMQVASVNLQAAKAMEFCPVDVPGVGRAFLGEPADDYGATRILLTGPLGELAARCQDDLLMAIPTRDLFLVVPSGGRDARHWLEDGTVKKFRGSPEGLTPQVFRYDRARGEVILA